MEANGFGGDVDAVADEFGVEVPVVENDAEDAGLAMIERAHGIEGVSCGDSTGLDGGTGFSCGGVGVADRDANTQRRGVLDELEGAGFFRSDGQDANVAAGGAPETIEGGDARGKDVRGWMHAALEVRDEGTFEVNAERARLRMVFVCNGIGCVLNGVGEPLECVDRAVDRCGDGGRQIVGDATGGEEALDGGNTMHTYLSYGSSTFG